MSPSLEAETEFAVFSRKKGCKTMVACSGFETVRPNMDMSAFQNLLKRLLEMDEEEFGAVVYAAATLNEPSDEPDVSVLAVWQDMLEGPLTEMERMHLVSYQHDERMRWLIRAGRVYCHDEQVTQKILDLQMELLFYGRKMRDEHLNAMRDAVRGVFEDVVLWQKENEPTKQKEGEEIPF